MQLSSLRFNCCQTCVIVFSIERIFCGEVERETDPSLPWYTWPAIGGGALLVILIAGYIVYKFRKKAKKEESRRAEAEEDVRRAEDGFFQTMDVVTDNPLQEIKLRHKQKDTVTLTDNV